MRDHLPTARYSFVALCLPCLLHIAGPSLIAQATDSPPNEKRPLPGSAFLNESPEALRALNEIRALREQGKLEKAVRESQRVLESYGDTLLEREDGTFAPLHLEMEARLGEYDHAWIETYRGIFSDRAHVELERLGDQPTAVELLAFSRRWRWTPAAMEALSRAVLQLHESGDVSGAWNALQMIHRHPDADLERYEQLPRRLQAPWEDSEISTETPVESSPFRRSPMWGHEAARRQVSVLADAPRELLWMAEHPSAWGAGRDWRAPGDGIGGHVSYPVTDGRRLFIQDANRIRAIGLHHGLTLWEYSNQPEGHDNARRPMGASNRGLLAPTVHDGLVFVALGHERDNPFTEKREGWESHLLCLRSDDGGVRWRVSADTFAEMIGQRDSVQPRSAWWWFDGSPLVYERAVYTVIRRQQSYGFESCYLARWDRLTGRCAWWTHVADGSVGRGSYTTITRCDPAAIRQVISVYTGLGVYARLSTTTGTLTDLLPVPTVAPRKRDPRELQMKPWTVRPLSVGQSLVMEGYEGGIRDIALDSASGALFLYCPSIRAHEQISADTLGNPDMVIGPMNRVMYAIGKEVIAFDLKEQRELWRLNLLREGESLDGLACLTDEAIWIPTNRGLAWVGLHGKGPQHWPWRELGLRGDAAQQGGNLLALGDVLISTRRTHTVAWACGRGAKPLLAMRANDQPEDPHAHLGLARYFLLRGHDRHRGMQALERAVDLADEEAMDPYGDPNRRRRIHRGVAELITEAVRPEGMLDTTEGDNLRSWIAMIGHLEIADRVRFRVWTALARAMETHGLWAEAVSVWQSIVVNTTAGAENHGPDSPRGQALDAQARILAEQGRIAFHRYDARASERLEEFRDSGSEEIGDSLIEDYAYASRADEIVRARSGSLVEKQEFKRAYEVLLTAWSRYLVSGMVHGPPMDETGLIAGLAESAWRDRQGRRALYWLRQGEQRVPLESVEMDGRAATMEEHAARLQRLQDFDDSSLPGLSFPLVKESTMALGEGGSLLIPDGPVSKNTVAPESPLWLVIEGKRWRSYAPATQTWPWEYRAEHGLSPSRLMGIEDSVVLTSPYQWWALDRANGQERWTWGAVPLTWNAPQVDPEIWRRLKMTAANDLWAAGVWDDGVMEMIRLRDGRCMWRRTFEQPVRRPLILGEVSLAYATRVGNKSAIALVDLVSGATVRTLVRPNDRLIHGMHFDMWGNLLVHGSDWIATYDTSSGMPRWEQTLSSDSRIAESIVNGGLLILTTQDGRIQARHVETGKPQWMYEASAGSRVARIDLAHERLLVIRDAQVEVIDRQSGKLQRTCTPAERGHVHNVWRTAEGLIALVREESRSEAARGDPVPWRLLFWRVEGDRGTATGRLFPEASFPLGEHARVVHAGLIEGIFFLHADDRLHRWRGPSPPRAAE